MQSGCGLEALSENEVRQGTIQVMVKDACVGEYYAILESSSVF